MRARLAIHVSPNARQTQVMGWRPDGSLHVKINAPPVDGKANEELVALLARLLDCPKRDVTVHQGIASKRKVVDIEGMEIEDVKKKLSPTLV